MIAKPPIQKSSPAALRARELAEIHKATCRARCQQLICGTCHELNEKARLLSEREVSHAGQ